jgi:hypothetical protein
MIKLRTLVTTALGVILFTGFLENSAEAYTFFSDRGSWTSAVQGLSITTEQFNIPDQVVQPLPFTFPSGFKEVPTNALGGSVVSNQVLYTGLAFPGSLDEFAFPSAVKGFGFDFSKEDAGGFSDKTFWVSGSGTFGLYTLPGDVGTPGFFGVVADANDPLIQNFQILGLGEIGSLGVDNVSFAKPVPEPTSTLSLLALGTLGAASTLKRKLKPIQSKELEKIS